MAYTPHPQHRNAAYATQKSQWTISVNDEQNCYLSSTNQNWCCEKNYFWGLHLLANVPSTLGTAPPPAQVDLQIAKFVGDDMGNWHGYPVAPWLSPFDKPSTNVLKIWLSTGLIKAQAFSKIKRGKRCAL